MVGNNIIAGCMTLFMGSLGDLLSRILFYNCSIDKAWTMLFFLPPLSIVSSTFYFLNRIEAATEPCKSAFDIFLIVIPILTILLKVLIPKMIENKLFSNAIAFILIVIMYAVIRMVKYNQKCNNMFNKKYKGIGSLQIKKAFINSLIINVIIAVLNAFSPFGQLIPVVGIAFRIWGYIGKIPGAQTGIPLLIMHLVNNLNEGSKSKMIATCCEQNDTCCVSDVNCPVDSESK